MRAFWVILVVGAATAAQAQYKAPSQYFRKNFPAPKQGQQQPPQQPAAPAKPAAPVQPKFKDVSTNSQFYFLMDTNRAYPWMKVSSTMATNVKTGVRQTLHPEVPVQR